MPFQDVWRPKFWISKIFFVMLSMGRRSIIRVWGVFKSVQRLQKNKNWQVLKHLRLLKFWSILTDFWPKLENLNFSSSSACFVFARRKPPSSQYYSKTLKMNSLKPGDSFWYPYYVFMMSRSYFMLGRILVIISYRATTSDRFCFYLQYLS